MTLIVLGLAWVAGLVAVGAWGAPWWMAGAWIAAAMPALLIGARGRYRLAAACVVAALAAGWLLARDIDRPAPAWLAAVDEEVTLTGTIDSEPDRGLTATGYVLRVEALEVAGREYHGGKVLVQLHQYSRYLPGDRLTLQGTLELAPVFDTFDYRAYLWQREIAAVMFRPRVLESTGGNSSVSRALTAARLELDRGLARSLPEPEASLAAGIAFGREDGLSPDAKDEYNRSGLRHLVAVSGSNVVLIAALTQAVAIPLIGRRRAWVPAVAMVLVYLAAAGLAPSVLRSGIMASVLLAGFAVGRPQSGMPALAGAVIAMTALSPAIALEAGFQLSATATAGIICFSPWISRWLLAGSARLRWAALPHWTCEAAALTLSATVATLPVTWTTFGRVSLISPLANILVQPAFVAAFCLSLSTALVSQVSSPAGAALGVVAYYPLAFIGWLAGWAGSQPYSSVSVGAGGTTVAVVAYAVLALAAGLAYWRRPAYVEPTPVILARRRSTRLVLAGMAGATALVAVPVSLTPRTGPGELVVQFLDIGQGDAALVTTPHGRQVLIDGGPSGLELARELGETMPHWDRSIDAVVLSHPQEDHIAGLPEVADRFAITTAYDSGHANPTLSFETFGERLPRRAVLAAGDAFELDGVRFEVVWPPPGYIPGDLNDASVILRITYGDTTVLFTGDAEEEALRQIDPADLRTDVLKVPHHGSRTTPAWFFESTGPSVAVIPVGRNPFGHPHASTLEALAGIPTYRTDLNGRVTVRSDGERIRVTTER